MSNEFVTANEIRAIVECVAVDAMMLDGSTETTIDFVGKLRGHIKALSTVDKSFTEFVRDDCELTNETPQGRSGTIEGVNWYASVVEVVRWTLDTKRVKSEMGDAWYDERCKSQVVKTTKYHENAS